MRIALSKKEEGVVREALRFLAEVCPEWGGDCRALVARMDGLTEAGIRLRLAEDWESRPRPGSASLSDLFSGLGGVE